MRKQTRQRLGLFVALLVGSVACRVALAAEFNVAQGGTASQSSTDFGGDAARAIDGNTNGNYGGNSVTHTAPDDQAPSWQVDLGKDFEISRIVVWGRTDCCMWRLSNFRISVLDDTSAEVDGEDPFPDLTYPDTTIAGFEWLPPAGTTGRTVVVSNLGPDSMGEQFISLAEVQVYSNATIAPILTTQPKGGKGFVGKKFTFTVEATGTEPLSYSWKHGVDVLGGQTSSTLTLDPLTLGDQGDYTCIVHNGAGDTPSNPANLRVFNGRNLARDGEASQSTEGYGGAAARANDGNTSGYYGDNSVTHTGDGDPAPAWEVLLYGPSTIESIYLWNRLDCCSDRLNNFKVLVLDIDRNEIWSDVYFAVDNANPPTYPDTSVDGFELDTFPAGTVGQIVRIEHLEPLNGSMLFLALAEVEVIGTGPQPPPSPNLCLREGAAATQSSEYNEGQFPAGNAINNVTTDFTHTGAGLNLPSTWEVNLGAENDIEEIVIFNRPDCCASRLRDITVSIWNLAGDTLVYESDLLNPENELGNSTLDMGPAKLSINLFEETGGFKKGGRVRIVRTPDDDLSGTGGFGNPDEMDVLAMAEVQVYTPVDCPAAGDTHCLPLFFQLDGPVGDGPGPYTIKARGSDDSGDNIKYTFTADNGKDPVKVIGPQAASQTTLQLGVGNWTVGVTVDDNLRCDDQAADASCSKPLTILGKENNQAPYGIATESSEGYEGAPGRANDGVTSGYYGDGSVSHTNDGDFEPWWEVELTQTYFVEKIVLWNRVDCCADRLTNIHVSVLDEDRNEVYGEDFFPDSTFPDTTFDGFEIAVPQPTEGRIVRVSKIGEFLSLAEVEVFSTAPPTGKLFHRGDADDNGKLELTDAVRVLNYLFTGGPAPLCVDAGDADDNGRLELTDAVRILGYLFLGQVPPAAPGPPPAACGTDTTPDNLGGDLGCLQYTHC